MDFQSARKLFPALNKYCYLSSSVQGPLTSRVTEEMQRLIEDMRDHVCLHEDNWIARLEEIREMVALLIQCDASEIAFIKNTADGINYIAEGFPFESGDNVVGIEGEYPANVYPWMNQQHRGVEFRMLPLADQGRVDLAKLVSGIL